MYVMKGGSGGFIDFDIALRDGDLGALKQGQVLRTEMRNASGKRLSKYATIRVGKTEGPNLDFKLSLETGSLDVTISEGYGYNYLLVGPLNGALCGSSRGVTIAIGNYPWQERDLD